VAFPQVSDIQNSYQPLSPGFMFTLREPPVSVIYLCNTLFGIILHTASNLYILIATGMTLAWCHLDFFLSCLQQLGKCWPISGCIFGFTGLMSTLITGAAILVVTVCLNQINHYREQFQN